MATTNTTSSSPLRQSPSFPDFRKSIGNAVSNSSPTAGTSSTTTPTQTIPSASTAQTIIRAATKLSAEKTRSNQMQSSPALEDAIFDIIIPSEPLVLADF